MSSTNKNYSSKTFTLSLAAFFLIIFAATGRSATDRNIIIFVADGLRSGSVTAENAPTLNRIKTEGVFFKNSHSLFPTVTTANASAIATGHALGDTGDFSNNFFAGYPLFDGKKPENSASQVPAVEDDSTLKDLDLHYKGNYLREVSLLSWAQGHGFSTAVIGKMGPALIQNVRLANLVGTSHPPSPAAIVVDNATGTPSGVPLPPSILEAIRHAGLPETVPSPVNGASGNDALISLNSVRQRYFTDVFLKVVLPKFAQAKKPFVAVYWCPTPDAIQHNQKDSLLQFVPGINGPASLAGIKNADENLRRILAYINAHPQLAKSTDIFVTADHGFSTVSKKWLDAKRTIATSSYSAGFNYKNLKGEVISQQGSLPPGFLAIDLAHMLGMHLFDPDGTPIARNGVSAYPEVDPRGTNGLRQYPVKANGMIGNQAIVSKHSKAEIVIASCGDSDLIYLTSPNRKLAARIVSFLATQDYVGGLFVNRKQCGRLPGALGLDQIQLEGTTQVPIPTIVVSFRSFALDPNDPTQSQVSISDASYQEGQGNHGGFGRGETFNFMAAIGPDFKKRYVDSAPVSNADVPITCAQILGLKLPSIGHQQGRALKEALKGGPDAITIASGTMTSHPTASGFTTQVIYQQLGQHRYLDAGGCPGHVVGIPK